ncbi:MAG: DNA translocase FtsK 4TM domain-containing protein, partial [bacterium]|nr:DNA translocase FtsK 4TM domain-containing protein [bacterium]
MAKKNKGSWHFLKNPFSGLSEGAIQGIFSIVFFAVSLFLILSSVGKAGIAGIYLYKILNNFFGFGFFLFPLVFLMLGVSFLKSLSKNFALHRTIGSILFFLSALGLITIATEDGGGMLGTFISTPLLKLFDIYSTVIFLGALVLIALLVLFDTNLLAFVGWIKLPARLRKHPEEPKSLVLSEEEVHKLAPALAPLEKESPNSEALEKFSKTQKTSPKDPELAFAPTVQFLGREYISPPLSLLESDRGKPGVGDIKANANIIKRTLQNFGIQVEMDEISIGPSVTRYALKPAEGVKISRIVTLQNDLALALAAHPLRIEAPIPGKSLVGIEIPNTTKTTVGLGTLLSNDEFQKTEKALPIVLGKGISGKSHFADLTKMPHLLIAGTTGSGKSVAIHAIITSLLYRNSPEILRFIMIDPKRVELTLYNKIPHLLTPVITDAKKAILSLKWAAKEMDRRYNVLESEAVRDIHS